MKVINRFSIFLITCLFSLVSYSEEINMERLEEGKPIIWIERSGKTRMVSGKILINAPVEESWKVLSAFDQWSEWAPGVEYHRIVGKDGDKTIGVCGMKMLVFTVYVPGAVVMDEENKTLYFRQLSGDEVKEYGKMGMEIGKANFTRSVIEEYKLESYGEKTIWSYSMKWDLKLPVPASVENFGTKVMAPDFLKAAKKKIESMENMQ